MERRRDWTVRQLEVLDLLAERRTNAEIALALGLTLDGAKWHVREIIAILGVASRDEVALYWRKDRSWVNRSRQLLAVPVLKLAAVVAVGACVASALGTVVLFCAIRLSQPGAAVPPGTALSTPSETVPIVECGSVPWERPPVTAMAASFANPRFGTSGVPGPEFYWIYLAKIYLLVPNSVSANANYVALSGVQEAETVDYPSSSCVTPTGPDILDRDVLVVDYKPVSLTRAGNTLTMTAIRAPGTLTRVRYKTPPSVEPGNFVLTLDSGQVIYQSGGGNVQQFDETGSLEFALLSGSQQSDVRVDPGTEPLDATVYSAASRPHATLSVSREADGASPPTLPATTPPPGWFEESRILLEPGGYRLQVDVGTDAPGVIPAPILILTSRSPGAPASPGKDRH